MLAYTLEMRDGPGIWVLQDVSLLNGFISVPIDPTGVSLNSWLRAAFWTVCAFCFHYS